MKRRICLRCGEDKDTKQFTGKEMCNQCIKIIHNKFTKYLGHTKHLLLVS